MLLTEYQDTFDKLINHYFLTEDMTYYTSLPKECVKKSKITSTFHSILAISNDELVTFLVLDEGDDKLNYTKNTNALLLRSFSTDSRQTKKGFAKKTLLLLPDFVKQNFPHVNEIVLAVNEKNTIAEKLYLQTGFIDSHLRIMGPKGKQKVLKQVV